MASTRRTESEVQFIPLLTSEDDQSVDPRGRVDQASKRQRDANPMGVGSRATVHALGGSEDLEEEETTSEVGAFARAHFSGPGAQVTARNLVPNSGIHVVPIDDLPEVDPNEFLTRPMQVSFHTNVQGGADDAYRNITLEKKGEGEEMVADTERQERVTQKFAQLKSLLCLGERGNGQPKAPASYSVTWHMITVFEQDDEGHTISKTYDLSKKEDVVRLIESRDGDASDVDHIMEQLSSIRETLTTKEYLGAEVGKFPTIAHDYMGNMDGVSPYQITSQALANTSGNLKSHLYSKVMCKRGLAVGEPRFIKKMGSTYTLTPQGQKAVNEMRQVRILQQMIVSRHQAEINKLNARKAELEGLAPAVTENDQRELAGLKKQIRELEKSRDEFAHASPFVMDFLIMELNGKAEYRSPVFNPDRSRAMVTNPHTGEEVPAYTPTAEKSTSSMVLRPLDHQAEGFDVSTPEGRHRADQKKNDYVDLVAGQVATDMGEAVKAANAAKWYKPWSKPHELATEERCFAAQVGSQLYDLIAEDDTSDPVRMRKIAFLQRQGVSAIPQEDRGVGLLLRAVLKPDSLDANFYAQRNFNPLVQEAVEHFRVMQSTFAGWTAPKEHTEAVKSLKTLDKETSTAIDGWAQQAARPTPRQAPVQHTPQPHPLDDEALNRQAASVLGRDPFSDSEYSSESDSDEIELRELNLD